MWRSVLWLALACFAAATTVTTTSQMRCNCVYYDDTYNSYHQAECTTTPDFNTSVPNDQFIVYNTSTKYDIQDPTAAILHVCVCGLARAACQTNQTSRAVAMTDPRRSLCDLIPSMTVTNSGECMSTVDLTRVSCEGRSGIQHAYSSTPLEAHNETGDYVMCSTQEYWNGCSSYDTCPIDCQVSDWSAGPCSVSCGTGLQQFTRHVITYPQGQGQPCPGLTVVSTCEAGPCPTDCIVGPWQPNGTCSRTCGGGTRLFSRPILQYPAANGFPCPPLIKSDVCNTQLCPVDCAYSDWTNVGSCSALCGGGWQNQTRSVIAYGAYGGISCNDGGLNQQVACNTRACGLTSDGGVDINDTPTSNPKANGFIVIGIPVVVSVSLAVAFVAWLIARARRRSGGAAEVPYSFFGPSSGGRLASI